MAITVHIPAFSRVRVLSVQSDHPVRVVPVNPRNQRVDFVSRGPRGQPGDKGEPGDQGAPGLPGTDVALNYVDGIPDLTLLFNNGLI